MSWEKTQKADFYEYRFYSDDKQHPFLYAADAGFPSFPLEAPPNAPVRRIRLNGFLFADSVEWSGKDSTFNREVLVILRPSTREHPPDLVHFIYLNATGRNRDLAEQIIASTKRVVGTAVEK